MPWPLHSEARRAIIRRGRKIRAVPVGRAEEEQEETQEHSPFDFAKGRQEWLCHKSKKTQEGGASPAPTREIAAENGLRLEIFQAFKDRADYQWEGDGGVFEDFG